MKLFVVLYVDFYLNKACEITLGHFIRKRQVHQQGSAEGVSIKASHYRPAIVFRWQADVGRRLHAGWYRPWQAPTASTQFVIASVHAGIR